MMQTYVLLCFLFSSFYLTLPAQNILVWMGDYY